MKVRRMDNLALIDRLEDFRAEKYLCTANHITIGYGFNMEAAGARDTWDGLDIKESFTSVFSGDLRLSKFSAIKLFDYQWKYCEMVALKRAAELNIVWAAAPEYKRFIWADIVYNTGSISTWSKVITSKDPRHVLFEARRKDPDGGHTLDSRLAKIGYYFGIISDLDDAIKLGLDEAKYII